MSEIITVGLSPEPFIASKQDQSKHHHQGQRPDDQAAIRDKILICDVRLIITLAQRHMCALTIAAHDAESG